MWYMFIKNLFEKLKFWLHKTEPILPTIISKDPLIIKTITLASNPRYPVGKLWGYRPESMIDKIIVHQELGEGNTVAVNNYHISKNCHIKVGGAPRIVYHYTIEKDGTVYLVNDHESVTWHCKGQNMKSIGIMLCGDFDGYNHIGKSNPTIKQLDSLEKLLDNLITELNLSKKSVFGHIDFGKLVCPGYKVMKFIHKYKG